MYKKTRASYLLGFIGGLGLLPLAQAAEYEVTVTNLTYGIHFTPLIVAAHPERLQMFAAGEVASAPMQAIAEGGDVSGMAGALESEGAAVAIGDGLLAPGASATFQINSDGSNNRLSVAGMLLPTNDGFVGLSSASLSDMAAGGATFYVPGYDAGTEANDEVVGGGAPGVAGFPAPPPVVATGTGTGGTGVHTNVEGFVHIHRNVIGDMDANGGVSDINSAVHRWLNPVARIHVRMMGGDTSGSGGPGAVVDLSAEAYSASAVEIFWGAADSADSFITGYEIRRDGTLLDTRDSRSFYDEGLSADTSYTYQVTPVDAQGRRGAAQDVNVSTL